MGKKGVLKFFFKITPIIITIFIVITSVINSKESLQRRFTLQDQEYQERTTSSRFDFISIGLDDFLSAVTEILSIVLKIAVPALARVSHI
jgi:preprotein translocase subunit SecG